MGEQKRRESKIKASKYCRSDRAAKQAEFVSDNKVPSIKEEVVTASKLRAPLTIVWFMHLMNSNMQQLIRTVLDAE